jgi:hypothetical protein
MQEVDYHGCYFGIHRSQETDFTDRGWIGGRQRTGYENAVLALWLCNVLVSVDLHET